MFLKAFPYFSAIWILTCNHIEFVLTLSSISNINTDEIDFKYEYLMTNLEVIYGSYGVETKPKLYNETLEPDSDTIPSSPGCPKSIEGYPWIYFGDGTKCFLAGTHGPCAFGERLLIQNGSFYGVCACECLFDYDHSKKLLGTDRYVQCVKDEETIPNQQVYDKIEKKCYHLYQKGPCPEGEVVVNSTRDSIKCLPLCDETRKDWQKMEELGLCKTPTYIFASVFGLEQNTCPNEDEKFSKILKKCVKQHHGRKLYVG